MKLTDIRTFVMRGSSQFFASLFLILVSGWTAREACRMGLGRLHAPGPGFMVFIAAVLLGVLAIHMLARSLPGGTRVPMSGEARKRRRKAASAFLVLAIGAALFEIAGYLLVTSLTLLFLFALLSEGKRNWPSMVLAAVVCAGLTYVVFSYWFKLQLPKGLIQWL